MILSPNPFKRMQMLILYNHVLDFYNIIFFDFLWINLSWFELDLKFEIQSTIPKLNLSFVFLLKNIINLLVAYIFILQFYSYTFLNSFCNCCYHGVRGSLTRPFLRKHLVLILICIGLRKTGDSTNS